MKILRAIALLGAFAAFRPALAQSSEQRAVIAVVQSMFDGMKTRDTALLRSVFDSSARLLPAPNSATAAPRVMTPSQFIGVIAGAPAGTVSDERMYEPDVKIDGPVAQLWTYYTFHRGSTFSHCGVDAFTLIKTAGAWKITHLIWSNRTEGCSHKEP